MFPQIFGKYVLERELASGGMARVFLATLRGAGGFEKRLVVKQIRPELASDQSFIQRFVAEAKTTVELSHANIVPVYELGTEQGVFYIAMELCSGVSLAELLRDGPTSPSEGAYIGVEICRALDYAHRKAGIVHRDVTPRNVMIDAEGMVKVIDFGIAAPVSSAASGALFGSPGHMAPEQLRPGPLTPAADVFAVAVLLIEAWTGHAPFRRESFAASADALREPPPPSRLNDPRLAALEPLIASALASSPQARPQTAEELARPLREFLRQDDLGDLARRLGQRVSQRSSRAASASTTAAPSDRSLEFADKGSAELPTRTFAARPALLEWTAKIDSVPPGPVGDANAAADTGDSSSSPTSVSGDPPAARASFSIDSGITAPAPLARESERSSGRRGSRFALSAAALAGALLLGLGGRHWMRAPAAGQAAPSAAVSAGPQPPPRADGHDAGQGRNVSTAPPRAGPSGPAAPLRTTPIVPPAAVVAAPLAPSGARSAVAGAARGLRSGVMQPRPSGAAAGARAQNVPHAATAARLQLTAEPPAWVDVDAVRVGRTPLHALAISPGLHLVRFVNPLLGERLEASVTLEPGAGVRVHADFTSASPQVHVR